MQRLCLDFVLQVLPGSLLSPFLDLLFRHLVRIFVVLLLRFATGIVTVGSWAINPIFPALEQFIHSATVKVCTESDLRWVVALRLKEYLVVLLTSFDVFAAELVAHEVSDDVRDVEVG